MGTTTPSSSLSAATAGTCGGGPATLRDGTVVEVRCIETDDRELLNDFHERCSDRTHYLRFFSMVPHLQPTVLERFVGVDHDAREALLAVLDGRIIGVARYDRLNDGTSAEVAFVVEDQHQGKGISSMLLQRLATVARGRGITVFRAETLSENQAMQHVFRNSGYPVTARRRPDDPGVVEFSFPIVEPDPGRVAGSGAASGDVVVTS